MEANDIESQPPSHMVCDETGSRLFKLLVIVFGVVMIGVTVRIFIVK